MQDFLHVFKAFNVVPGHVRRSVEDRLFDRLHDFGVEAFWNVCLTFFFLCSSLIVFGCIRNNRLLLLSLLVRVVNRGKQVSNIVLGCLAALLVDIA